MKNNVIQRDKGSEGIKISKNKNTCRNCQCVKVENRHSKCQCL